MISPPLFTHAHDTGGAYFSALCRAGIATAGWADLRAEFQRSNPCPSTGRPRGPCPGYQVDHREALICGGRDELANLQWLPVVEHREKTRVEVKLCRPRASAAATR